MKKLVSFVLAVVMVCSVLPFSVFAEEQAGVSGDAAPAMCVRIWENPNPDEDVENSSVLRYGEQVQSQVVATEYRSVTTTPSGQPSGGYSFPSTGGSIYINTNGGSTVTYSVGVSWGTVSVGVSVGSISTSVTGVSVFVPGDGNHYKVQLRHNYKINRVKHDYYQYGEYLYTIYTDKPILQSVDALLIRV